MPRKKKSKVYFGKDVQDAIIRYNGETNNSIKQKIYQTEIHAAFDKLAENIINTFKFSYFDYGFEDIKCEVVAFLFINIHKYDHTKGSKAFSYFSVVAKNYLILHNNNNYKKMKIHDNIDVLKNRNISGEKEKQEKLNAFVVELIKYMNKKIPSIFKSKIDIKIAYALIKIFETRSDIENFNKKFIYLLIREMTDVNTAQITKVVKTMKKHYKKLFNVFDKNGHLEEIEENNYFF